MNPNSTTILAISTDAELLGTTYSLLTSLGYHVTCSNVVDSCAALARVHRPDIVLADTRTEGVSSNQLREVVACNLLAARIIAWAECSADECAADDAELAKLIDAGAEDIVAPNAWGELLCRLQSAARLLEFEKRLAAACGVNPRTKFMDQDAFAAESTRRWESNEVDGCIHFTIDNVPANQTSLGADTLQNIIDCAAQVLWPFAHRFGAASGDDNGNYQLLLPVGCSCLELAEELRLAFANLELTASPLPGSLPLTISCGVATVAESNDPITMLQTALDAARIASQRGGNQVVSEEQLRTLASDWKRVADPDVLFASTSAKHLMTPFAWCLRCDESLHHAEALLEQTALDCLPVVDDEACFAGLLFREQVEGDLGRHVSEVCSVDVPQIADDATFQEVMDKLLDTDERLLVVMDAQRPAGMIRAADAAVLDQLPTWSTLDESVQGTGRLVVA